MAQWLHHQQAGCFISARTRCTSELAVALSWLGKSSTARWQCQRAYLGSQKRPLCLLNSCLETKTPVDLHTSTALAQDAFADTASAGSNCIMQAKCYNRKE